jgi:hypothetical protein
MQKPSDIWKRIRRATLDRIERGVIKPLEPLYSIYVGVCLCYLVGFMKFQFFRPDGDFTLTAAMYLSLVAICGGLVPILTGSVLILHFVSRRFRRLVGESYSF